MTYFLELWKPRTRWLEMDRDERAAYVEEIAPHIEELLEAGVELLAMGPNRDDLDHRGPYPFWAVWRIPDEELLERFQRAVREDGFYDYFEQINAGGEPVPPEELFGEMVEL